MRYLCVALVLLLVGSANLSLAIDRPSLDGKVSFLPSYFFDDGQLHQSRFELSLKETVPLSNRLLTVIRGRARVDPSFLNLSFTPGHSYTSDVRNDEGFEAEGREAYLDYLTNTFRLKVGLQSFDWVESLSPLTTNVLTSLDLRNGGQESIDEIIVPTFAVNLNHKALKGTLDWMLVPLPKTDRMPLGDNGFGYFPYLQHLSFPATAVVVNQPIPQQLDQVEAGVRYLTSLHGVDLTLLGYYGHQRMPALTLSTLSPSQIQAQQSYPRIATFGLFLTYAADSEVIRFVAIVEPGHAPAIHVDGTPGWSELWTRIGVGFDYNISDAFKAYSEVIARYASLPQNAPAGGGWQIAPNRNDYVATVRVTNESIKKVALSLTSTLTGPNFSFSLNPEVVYTAARNLKVSAGGYLVGSNATASDFESLKGTSRIYFLFEYLFNMR